MSLNVIHMIFLIRAKELAMGGSGRKLQIEGGDFIEDSSRPSQGKNITIRQCLAENELQCLLKK